MIGIKVACQLYLCVYVCRVMVVSVACVLVYVDLRLCVWIVFICLCVCRVKVAGVVCAYAIYSGRQVSRAPCTG